MVMRENLPNITERIRVLIAGNDVCHWRAVGPLAVQKLAEKKYWSQFPRSEGASVLYWSFSYIHVFHLITIIIYTACHKCT